LPFFDGFFFGLSTRTSMCLSATVRLLFINQSLNKGFTGSEALTLRNKKFAKVHNFVKLKKTRIFDVACLQ